jgi:hypothetical protein
VVVEEKHEEGAVVEEEVEVEGVVVEEVEGKASMATTLTMTTTTRTWSMVTATADTATADTKITVQCMPANPLEMLLAKVSPAKRRSMQPVANGTPSLLSGVP